MFPHEAAGSLIEQDGKVVGSALIGQPFSGPQVLLGPPVGHGADAVQRRRRRWARTSARATRRWPTPAQARVEALQAADPDNKAPVPVDLVTASGSGLDPHISPAAARYQAARVARLRGLPLAQVEALIAANTEQARGWAVFGEPGVNVLKLNLALDGAKRGA